MSKVTETDLDCPTCRYHFELSSGVDHDQEPHDGAVSLCIRCATPAFFAEVGGKLYLRPLTPDEWAEIVTIEGIAKTRAGILWVQSTGSR